MASLEQIKRLVDKASMIYDDYPESIEGMFDAFDELRAAVEAAESADSACCPEPPTSCEPCEPPASCCVPKPSACCVPCPSGYVQVPVLPGYQTVITITDAASLPCED